MVREFYSNGKLLITGEYAILDGAKGLALPTKFGQFLTLHHSETDTIRWKSFDEKDTIWFSTEISKNNLENITSTDEEIAQRLVNILKEARRLNPAFLADNYLYNSIESKITFPRNWGLGTSSTLIANIATWANINPYKLLESTFGGSGYDIACATSNSPITYQRNGYEPIINEVAFKPSFINQLFFVYLNQKKNSRDAINSYKNLNFNKKDLISKINIITENILLCDNLKGFELLLNEHEAILSNTLKVPTIKSRLFPDYSGTIKSLGAWGGDFVLATGTEAEMLYFKKKGFDTIVSYPEMIL
jgi:mevalonate kinase